MLVDDAQIESAYNMLIEIRSLLEKENENNWRRGIDAAISEMTNQDGTLNKIGFENARSIYKTMTAGGRGFSEYYIWKNNENDRIAENKRLDNLRAKAWEILGK